MHPPSRQRLLAQLAQVPGASVAELARACHLDHSTATYHLRRLEREGIAACRRQGSRLHWFLVGSQPHDARAWAIASRLPGSRAVMAQLRGSAPLALGQVARGLTMTRAGVYWHLRRLEALGLVVVEGAPRARRYRAAAGAPRVAVPMRAELAPGLAPLAPPVGGDATATARA